jgi:DNA-binding transcriptional ArsR family regulator
MPGRSYESITDPERIRALAHPLRLELLDLLGDVDEATATECADHTGESVASCSFHLRMLAKYGFIEPAQRRGREKPWRLSVRSHNLQPSSDTPGSLAAVGAVGEMLLLRETERISRFFRRAHEEDEAWVLASTLTRATHWLTLEELKELAAEFQEIAHRFEDRITDRSARPEGARKVQMLAALHPEPEDGRP